MAVSEFFMFHFFVNEHLEFPAATQLRKPPGSLDLWCSLDIRHLGSEGGHLQGKG